MAKLKEVFVPYDAAEDLYLDAYPTEELAQTRIDNYARACCSNHIDVNVWKEYAAEHCWIIKFKVKWE